MYALMTSAETSVRESNCVTMVFISAYFQCNEGKPARNPEWKKGFSQRQKKTPTPSFRSLQAKLIMQIKLKSPCTPNPPTDE